MKTLSAVVLALVAHGAWACDDGSPVTTVVGLLNGDRLLIREERFEGARIDLYVLDLVKNKVTEFASIVELKDAEEDRARLRAARWKAAEVELKKQGLRLQTLPLQTLPVTVKGVPLSVRPASFGKQKCAGFELLAADKRVESASSCWPIETSYAGVIVTPDERFVVPMKKSNCLDAPTSWMTSISVASFAKP